MKILSIDDSKAVHAFLNSCLEGTPHKISHAYDGTSGIQLVTEKQTEFDLILLDWEMPGLTGPDVVKKLNEQGNSVPIIMLTSKNSVDDIGQMLQMGVKEYIMKPFTKDILLEKIENLS